MLTKLVATDGNVFDSQCRRALIRAHTFAEALEFKIKKTDSDFRIRHAGSRKRKIRKMSKHDLSHSFEKNGKMILDPDP